MQGYKSSIGAVNRITIDLLYSDIADLPAAGEESSTSKFKVALGGGPVAALATAARLGATVRLATRLGADAMSQLARQFLRQEQIPYHSFGTVQPDDCPVCVTSVVTLPDGERSFLSYFPEEGEAGIWENRQVYSYLEGMEYCIASAPCPALFQNLRHRGCKIAYDVGWSDELNLEGLKEILQQVSLFTPNEKEAMKITGERSPEAALLSLARYVEIPIVKIGAEGCLILEAGVPQLIHSGRFHAVDTTGAGDAFLGGMVYALTQGWSLRRAAILANFTGGYATTQFGCLTAKGTKEDALRFVTQREAEMEI